MDPAVISSCIPGCDSFEPAGEDRYRARLTVALAAITGTYEGTVTLSDQVPHDVVPADGRRAGAAGFVKGSSAITLRADGATTIVDVAGTVQTGGPIARLGQRLIGGVSKMMLDRFFACLQAKLASALPTLGPSRPRSARRVNTGIIARRYSSLAWMSELTSLQVLRRRPAPPPRSSRCDSGLSRERLLDVRSAGMACDAGAGQADARRRDRAAVHVERRRDADDGEVRRALVQLGVGRGSAPARTARRR